MTRSLIHVPIIYLWLTFSYAPVTPLSDNGIAQTGKNGQINFIQKGEVTSIETHLSMECYFTSILCKKNEILCLISISNNK